MTNKLTTNQLFHEFSLTKTPFEKWELFAHITDDAVLIYLPNNHQSMLCKYQVEIFNQFKSGKKENKENAENLMAWLFSHKEHVVKEFGTASPQDFYSSLKELTPAQVITAQAVTQDVLLAFNPQRLVLKKPSLLERIFKK